MGFLDKLLGRGKKLADQATHRHEHGAGGIGATGSTSAPGAGGAAPGPAPGGAVPEAGTPGSPGGAGASTPETDTSGQVTPP